MVQIIAVTMRRNDVTFLLIIIQPLEVLICFLHYSGYKRVFPFCPHPGKINSHKLTIQYVLIFLNRKKKQLDKKCNICMCPYSDFR